MKKKAFAKIDLKFCFITFITAVCVLFVIMLTTFLNRVVGALAIGAYKRVKDAPNQPQLRGQNPAPVGWNN